VISLAQRRKTKAYEGDLEMHAASSIIPDLTPLLHLLSSLIFLINHICLSSQNFSPLEPLAAVNMVMYFADRMQYLKRNSLQ
jgi:hypothetical protein